MDCNLFIGTPLSLPLAGSSDSRPLWRANERGVLHQLSEPPKQQAIEQAFSRTNQAVHQAFSKLSQSFSCGFSALCVKIDVNCILTGRKVMSQHPQARSIIIGAAALALTVASALVIPNALAQRPDGHVVLAPEEIRWSPGPPSIPAGAQAVVMYGDPGKDGLFALRLKLPKGYAFAPHTRPKPEIVTVISGTFRLGMGEGADPTKALAAGILRASARRSPLRFRRRGYGDPTQRCVGPWSLTYVNPKDDPRNKGQ